jgi:transposase
VLRGFRALHKVGVESTGSYGSALARYLAEQDVSVLELRSVETDQLISTCVAFRVGPDDDSLLAITRLALRGLAQHIQLLEAQLERIVVRLARITKVTAPDLIAAHGVGPDTASTLLVSAGDNPRRLDSECAWAALLGSNPFPASCGKANLHRLHRGGDRQANARPLAHRPRSDGSDPDTRAYVDKRIKEGKSKREAIRCLKRYIARELYPKLPREALA